MSNRAQILGFLAIGCLECPLVAQIDRATLNGRVFETAGTGLADVTVDVVSNSSGLHRSARTSASGTYQITGLPIGKYSVAFSRASVQVLLMDLAFKPVRLQNVELFVGENRTLDVQMDFRVQDAGPEAQASVVQVRNSTAGLAKVIQPDQVQSLPLNGRNWSSLMVLAPGSIDTGQGNQESIRFIGRSRDDNNWTLDGIDSTGIKKPRHEAQLRLVISSDAIAEFRVGTTLYGTGSGTAHGAQIDVVSKSGGNEFHGGLFEFFRNDKLDSNKPFVADRTPFHMNQFGASLGGPIKRDRMFFYANYEGLRQQLTQTLFGLVPSDSFRESVLSTSPGLRPILDAYPKGFRRTVDPNIDDYRISANQTWREDSGLLRVDHRFSSETTAFARYNVDDALIFEPLNAVLDKRTSNFRTSNIVAELQRVFSPDITGEVRLGMNRSAFHRLSLTRLANGLNVPGLTSFGDTISCSVCTGDSAVDAGTSYSLVQNLVAIRGKHTWKAGSEIRRIQLNGGNSAGISESYATLADFAQNRIDSISINGELATRGARRTYYLPYVQDEFKVRPNLTLTLGVRYEYYTVLKEVLDRARVFDIQGCRGFCAPGSPLYFPDRNNFDPRIGISWSPEVLGNKTAIRAGFGAYHGTGQNIDVAAAITSAAERFSLSQRDVPGLSFPIAPFLSSATALGVTPRSLQRDRRDPYSEQWGFSIEQELPRDFAGEARYVGTSAHKIFSRAFVNVIDPLTARRPLPQFGKIDEKRNDGNSSFNGLLVSIRRPLQQGLLWEANYMWSHSINDNSVGGGEAGQPQNTNCRRCERASSDFDIRHTFTTSFIYQLPSVRVPGLLFSRKLLSSWDVSGIGTARKGTPINVTISRSSASLPDGNNTNQRPNLVGGVSLYPAGGPSPNMWINSAAFAVPSPGQWGSAGRNLLRGPSLWEGSLALSKKCRITEQLALHFRAEVFNIFNRSQLANPLADLASPGSFGRITAPLNREATGTGAARQIQGMLRLVF